MRQAAVTQRGHRLLRARVLPRSALTCPRPPRLPRHPCSPRPACLAAGYRKYAWGQDELKPRSNGSKNWLHQAATMVDSLDTLWLMGFKADFYAARDWIGTHLRFDHAGGVSVFETIIRSLGGLLAAYELSSDQLFLDKARELADVLLKAFATPTGLPCTTLNMRTGACTFASWTGQSAILSEYGTVQLELKALSQHTGDPKYAAAAMRVMKLVASLEGIHGMAPTYLSPKTGRYTNRALTWGALGDSYYEVWLDPLANAPRHPSPLAPSTRGLPPLTRTHHSPLFALRAVPAQAVGADGQTRALAARALRPRRRRDGHVPPLQVVAERTRVHCRAQRPRHQPQV